MLCMGCMVRLARKRERGPSPCRLDQGGRVGWLAGDHFSWPLEAVVVRIWKRAPPPFQLKSSNRTSRLVWTLILDGVHG